MIRTVILFLFLIWSSITNAGLIRNVSLDNPELEILYLNVENVLELNSSFHLKDVRMVSKRQGEIAHNEIKNLFYFIPNEFGVDTLFIFINDSCVQRTRFIVMRLSSPLARLGNSVRKRTNIKEIIRKPYVSVIYPGCHYISKIKVNGFQMCIVHGKDTTRIYEPLISGTLDTIYVIDPITGLERIEVQERNEQLVYNLNEKLTAYQIERVSEVKRGDKILITEIRVRDGNNGCGKTRTLNDIIIEII